MKIIKQSIIILTACFITHSANAASPLEIPGKPFSALSSDTVEVKNWKKISGDLISIFGGEVISATPSQLDELAALTSPIAYTADLGSVKLLNIVNQPIPQTMWSLLHETFEDLDKEHFEEYDKGITIVATDNGNNSYAVRAILLKGKDNSAQSGGGLTGESFVLNDKATLNLPFGTSILTSKKRTQDDTTVEIYRMQIKTSSKDFAGFVKDDLASQGISYDEKIIGAISTLTVDVDEAHAQLSYETDAASSKTSTVSLSIYRFE